MEAALLDFATALAALDNEETPATLERHRAALSAVEVMAIDLLNVRKAQIREKKNLLAGRGALGAAEALADAMGDDA
jgi:hypothetical protein